MRTQARILPLDAKTYVPHLSHTQERAWVETNCYVDLWLEQLHALGLEPFAACPFTLELDFEGDQFSFYKFPLEDLRALYGIDVHELNLWRPVLWHALEQVACGHPFLVEMDSWYLPDTAGVSYRLEHTKTSISINDLDAEKKQLGYFHGSGYHRLSGEDFDGVFRLTPGIAGPNVLLPYVEIARLEGLRRPSLAEQVAGSIALTRQRLAQRPKTNPFLAWRPRFIEDMAWLRGEEVALFHQYAFATLRQAGSCFELCASWLRWLERSGEKGLLPAAQHFEDISSGAKAMQFKTARAVMRKQTVDFSPQIEALAASWDSGIAQLVSRYGD